MTRHILGILCLSTGMLACQMHPKNQSLITQTLVFPVDVTPVTLENVEYTVTSVGSVEAFEKVFVTARVAGVVERILFTEGDTVKRGQALVDIELDRYVLAVKAAQAALQQGRAALKDAQAGVSRRERVMARVPGVVAGEELQTWRTQVLTHSAEVQQAQVALQQAQLNLRQAQVKAPIQGVVQTREVQTGQYVEPGKVLASLIKQDPLLLRFQVGSSDAAKLKRGMEVHFRLRHSTQDLIAHIIHVAAAAQGSARLFPVAAKIEKASAQGLRPGVFVKISLSVGETSSAPVIPQTALRPSERGFLAYVVQNGVAQERHLSLGMHTSDGRVEVQQGLQAGDALVIRGAEALYDGAKVQRASQSSDPAGLHPGLTP